MTVAATRPPEVPTRPRRHLHFPSAFTVLLGVTVSVWLLAFVVPTGRYALDADGRPVEVAIERTSGSNLLDDAARKFVKARWHFVPAMQDGRAMEAFALRSVEQASAVSQAGANCTELWVS